MKQGYDPCFEPIWLDINVDMVVVVVVVLSAHVSAKDRFLHTYM